MTPKEFRCNSNDFELCFELLAYCRMQGRIIGFGDIREYWFSLKKSPSSCRKWTLVFKSSLENLFRTSTELWTTLNCLHAIGIMNIVSSMIYIVHHQLQI